jgi:hypothetical protein
MADADLDALIRQLAKQQTKALTAAVKKRRDRAIALAAKAKDAESKRHQQQLAKDILEIGTATVKRLQMSADNAAYSYARSIRQAIDTAAARKAVASAKPTKKAAKKASKKEAKKATGKAKG